MVRAVPVVDRDALLLILALAGSFILILGLRHAATGIAGIFLAFGRWGGTIILLSAAFAILVRFAPAERRSKRLASAGATMASSRGSCSR